MLDFMKVSTKNPKKGVETVYPIFIVGNPVSDLMCRGGDFYAIWDEDNGFWSTDRNRAIQLIDRELDIYATKYRQEHPDVSVSVDYLWNTDTGSIDKFLKYVQKQALTPYHQLDEKITFYNDSVKREDFVTKKLKYPLEDRPIPAYEELMNTLYSPAERRKLEWAIGSIITGDSKYIQKFLVLYGSAGTGKSTVLNIIQKLFEGYYCVFDAKSLGSANNSFALEAFRSNPLIAIQHDGDLSHIEDNTRLNSLVSHEEMTVNEKFKSTYTSKFNCMLFMGTNKPVKITDAKSGIIRRLIDISPTGEKVTAIRYKELMGQINFELGGIAKHCKDIYLEDPDYYEQYIPTAMIGASNDFYNFIIDSYERFAADDMTTANAAWEMYNRYNEKAKVPYPYSFRAFKEELKNYFREYKERGTPKAGGERVRSLYLGFLTNKFEFDYMVEDSTDELIFKLDSTESLFDSECAFCQAQYANDNKAPISKWEFVKTTLSEIDTTRLHYVRPPENHIVIDFDIKNEKGEKSFELNAREAAKWPPTYAELSQGGNGIHLHYIYTGDVKELSHLYDEDIEIKVFTGKSSLRRRLSRCNRLPVATISPGYLPLKVKKPMVNVDVIRSEAKLREQIMRNLRKEVWDNTTQSVSLILKILDDAYNSGMKYDVTQLRPAVLEFAAKSTHQSKNCIRMVGKMKFKSDEPSIDIIPRKNEIAFFDIEIFPNLFMICWLPISSDEVNVLYNPSPAEIEPLLSYGLVGFNNRRYDNHIIYAAYLGWNNAQLYDLSQKIIAGSPNSFFNEAWSVSETDIYDYCATKKSLKQWEIDLGIPHKECNFPWDKPVDEKDWKEIAEYCCNDVRATKAVWEATAADRTARQMLVDINKQLGNDASMNDTTNTLTTKIIFGKEKKPELVYTELEKPQTRIPSDQYNFYMQGSTTHDMITHSWTKELPEATILPYFPGYSFDNGKNMYRGEDVGKGGYVYAEPGMYYNVALLDIQSMHPSSILAMYCFGEHTKRFKDIYDARVAIKHKDYATAKQLMGGVLAPYLNDTDQAKQVAQALKIAINSVYGLTSANFENPFRDIRNMNNIVALRGALFMVNLKHEVQNRGFTVAHIKTDSIKIPEATPEIIEFCKEYALKYGYIFEHEATYEKMCLVNDAVYIAKYSKDEINEEHKGEWTATGTQFQVPYVFKTLFSKEPIEFSDMCETKKVTTALYLDMNENLKDVTKLEQELFVITKGNREFERQKELKDIIDANHDYKFIGKVGLFCPVKPGYGGGLLMREKDGKYSSATGAKGFRWLESDDVKNMDWNEVIDKSYYKKLVDDAVENISQYGDFEAFVSNDIPFDGPYV